jgi:hypothetical protein
VRSCSCRFRSVFCDKLSDEYVSAQRPYDNDFSKSCGRNRLRLTISACQVVVRKSYEKVVDNFGRRPESVPSASHISRAPEEKMIQKQNGQQTGRSKMAGVPFLSMSKEEFQKAIRGLKIRPRREIHRRLIAGNK